MVLHKQCIWMILKPKNIQTDGNNTGVVLNVADGDTLIIRKSTSDGTFPNEQTYDSIIPRRQFKL